MGVSQNGADGRRATWTGSPKGKLGGASESNALQFPEMLHLKSEDKRNDAFGSSPIISISLGELLQHQFFFVAKFNPETRKHQECAHKPGQVSLRERGGKEHGDYPGVDW